MDVRNHSHDDAILSNENTDMVPNQNKFWENRESYKPSGLIGLFANALSSCVKLLLQLEEWLMDMSKGLFLLCLLCLNS